MLAIGSAGWNRAARLKQLGEFSGKDPSGRIQKINKK